MYLVDDDIPKSVIRHYEIALSKIDQVIQTLSVMTQGKVFVYDHGTPIRSVEYIDSDELGKRILVEPANLHQNAENFEPLFNIELEAWKDDGSNQKTWHKRQLMINDFPDDYASQLNVFEQCLEELRRVKPSQLE